MSTLWIELAAAVEEMVRAPGFASLLGASMAIFILVGAYVNGRGVDLKAMAILLLLFITAEEALRLSFLRSVDNLTIRPAILSTMAGSCLLLALAVGGLLNQWVNKRYEGRREEVVKYRKAVEDLMKTTGSASAEPQPGHAVAEGDDDGHP